MKMRSEVSLYLLKKNVVLIVLSSPIVDLSLKTSWPSFANLSYSYSNQIGISGHSGFGVYFAENHLQIWQNHK